MLAVRIPAGLTHPHQMSGIPVVLAVALTALPILAATLTPWYMTAAVLPLDVVLVVFAIRRTRKDQNWLPIWLKHNSYAPYYRA